MSNSTPFSGTYKFPGTFAFFDTPASTRPALLQFDNPPTGVFDDLTAQNTAGDLQGRFQDGEPGTVTGVILDRDVNGIDRPVLFFTTATVSLPQTSATLTASAVKKE